MSQVQSDTKSAVRSGRYLFYRHLSKLNRALEILLVGVVVWLVSVRAISDWVIANNYVPSYSTIGRVVLLGVIILGLLLLGLRGRSGVYLPNGSKFVTKRLAQALSRIRPKRKWVFARIVVFIFLLLFVLTSIPLIFATAFYFKLYIYGLVVGYTIIIVAEPRTLKVISTRIAFWVLFAVGVLVTLFPFYSDTHLNSEGYLGRAHINAVSSVVSREHQTYRIDVELDQKLQKRLDLTHKTYIARELQRKRDDKGKRAYFIFDERRLGSRNASVVSFFSSNISALCLLGSYNDSRLTLERERLAKDADYLNFFNSPQECVKQLWVHEENPTRLFYIISDVRRIPLMSAKTETDILRSIAGGYQKKVSEVPIEPSITQKVRNFLSVLTTRGYYFHHYVSISQTFNEHSNVLGLFKNQYGFGPLILPYLAKNLFSLTNFDSIYFTTIAINLLALLLILLVMRRFSFYAQSFLMLGFTASIVTVNSTSFMMAPYVYYIRMLPLILIFLYLVYHVLKETSFDKTVHNKCLFGFFLLLSTLWNFEYGVLTAGGVFLSGVVLRNWFLVWTSMASGTMVIIIKVIASIAFGSDDDVGTRYMGYFSVNAFDNPFDLLATGFFLFLGLLLFIVTRHGRRRKLPSELVLLGWLTLVGSAKMFFINAGNHIGPQLVMLAFLTLAIQHSLYGNKWVARAGAVNFPDNTRDRRFSIIAITFFALYLVWGIIRLDTHQLNNRIHFESYERSQISDLFPTSATLTNKLKAFKGVFKSGDLVLSPTDNVLHLYVGMPITRPWYDVTNNMSTTGALSVIAAAYNRHPAEHRIIVDKIIAQPEKFASLKRQIVELPILTGVLYHYLLRLEKFKEVFSKLENLRKCGGNKHFDVFCRK